MIINSAAYRGGRRVADLPMDDISEALKEPGTFVWLGLHEPDFGELKHVQSEFGLHDLAIEDALKAHQRAKLETYGDTLFVVINTVQVVDGTPVHGETHVFVGANFIVTVRHGASSSYKVVRQRCEAMPLLLAKGPAFVLYSVLDYVVDNFQEIAGHLETRFAELEQQIFNDKFDRDAIGRLYELKGHLTRLRGATMPVQDICSHLVRLHENFVPRDLRAYFRDVEDHASRVVGVVDMIREMLTTAISVNLALVTVTQNEVVKRLAGWGAVLAVPTVIFSMYGMNFQFMPELKFHYAYPIVIGVTLAACVGLFWRLRRAGWL